MVPVKRITILSGRFINLLYQPDGKMSTKNRLYGIVWIYEQCMLVKTIVSCKQVYEIC